jgi:spoIIIJ-associated protein
MDKNKKVIEKTLGEFLKLLEIKGQSKFEENEEEIVVNLETDDGGIVIGRHGDTLASLQLILAFCLSKKLGVFKRVLIDVDGYRENRSEWLKNLAFETKEKVLQEGKEFSIPDLKPWERRVVHLSLQDDQEVISESIGEGEDRVLVVRPKN